MAAEKGLILVDTKYEFGKKDGKIYLIDEIHTPDSSRYFYKEGYEERFKEKNNVNSRRVCKKMAYGEWISGKEGQEIPEMTDAYCASVSGDISSCMKKL